MRRGSVQVWIDNKLGVTAAAICIGPLSTLTTNRATRISQINWSREVCLGGATQFCGVLILLRVCPTTTTRVGASDWQNSSITVFESDLSWPRAKGGKRTNGGWGSKRGSGSPLGTPHTEA